MKLGRIILALLIALSVATLPAAGTFGIAAKSPDSAEMSAMEDMDCCPPVANPCDKAMGDCTSMAACALKCFGFSPSAYSIVAFPLLVASLGPSSEHSSFRPQSTSPPFRPPRV